MQTPRVYTASKTHHAQLWLDIRKNVPEIHWTARWPYVFLAGIPETPESAKTFWLDDELDIQHSTVLLVYSAHGEDLRGALVEAGMAIAMGVQVILIGEAACYGTWQFHPACQHAESLGEALEILGASEDSLARMEALRPANFGVLA